MTITVTQKDIDDGYSQSITSCPIALSVNRAFDQKVPFAVVNQGEVVIGVNHYPLPSPAKKFIVDFDAAKPVKPIEFELETED